jgi:hypothetical protein
MMRLNLARLLLQDVCTTKVERGRTSMVSIASRRFIAVAAFTALGSLSTALPARADGVLNSFMNLLGMEEDQPEVTYRERAPLVVPPTMALRPPEQSKVEANPAWPKDPDVERRKQADLLKKYPGGVPESERRRFNGERASMGEMAGSRSARSSQALPDGQDTLADRKHADWVRPDVLARDSEAATKQATMSGVEPARQYLTDPPSGLRKPSANAEFKAPRLGRAGIADDSGSPLSVLKKPAAEPED